MPLSGAAVAYATAGGLILYSGIKGATLSATVKGVLAGNLNVTGTETIDFSSPASTGSSSSGGGSGNTPNVSPGADQKTWINDLLSALNAPSTQANISSITNWMAHEEPPSDWAHWNNPMNTTQPEGGSTSQNSVHVQAYPNLMEGLQATVQTLNNGLYGDILMLLRSGQGLKSGAAQGLSTWSNGAYTSV